MNSAGDGFVEHERECRNGFQRKFSEEIMADVTRGAAQALKCFGMDGLLAEDAYVHPGIFQVSGRLDAGNRNETNARVLDVTLQKPSNLFQQELVYSVHTI